jgi:hypothetical protein
MPEPDPRDRALQNIQDSSRAYGRGRRRGDTANVDPAFAAALEITDPEQRRAALSQYARQRAQGMMPQGGASMQGNPLPSQASVMSQFAGPDRMQAAEDKQMQESGMMADRMRGAGLINPWQNQPMPGAEDSPETHRMLMDSGREMQERQGDDQMFADIKRFAPEQMGRYQNIPMAGVEDSPEQFRARQNMGKQILAPTYGDQIDERNDGLDDERIEGFHDAAAEAAEPPAPHPAPDGIAQIGNAVGNLEQQIMARRRRR